MEQTISYAKCFQYKVTKITIHGASQDAMIEENS